MKVEMFIGGFVADIYNKMQGRRVKMLEQNQMEQFLH